MIVIETHLSYGTNEICHFYSSFDTVDYVDKNGAVRPAPFFFVACSEAKSYLSVGGYTYFFSSFFKNRMSRK